MESKYPGAIFEPEMEPILYTAELSVEIMRPKMWTSLFFLCIFPEKGTEVPAPFR